MVYITITCIMVIISFVADLCDLCCDVGEQEVMLLEGVLLEMKVMLV